MLRVGLTGSIGVGKSFVSGVLAELGCHVLDADETAREVVIPGSIGLQAVVAEFGEDILTGDGALTAKTRRSCLRRCGQTRHFEFDPASFPTVNLLELILRGSVAYLLIVIFFRLFRRPAGR